LRPAIPPPGKSDPLVEVFTTPNYRYETRYISNSLEPVWEETFFLPVLEKDQVGVGKGGGC
jgi:Ca2+-dependent lipid-binding protein